MGVKRISAARSLATRRRIVEGRRERGEPSPYERAWTGLDELQLGRYSDADAAERIGCSIGAIARRRRKLGIPAAIPIWPEARTAKLVPVSGEWLLSRRIAIGLTQEQFAKRAGVSAAPTGGLRIATRSILTRGQ